MGADIHAPDRETAQRGTKGFNIIRCTAFLDLILFQT